MNAQQLIYAILCVIGTVVIALNSVDGGLKEGFWGNVEFTTRAVPIEYNPKTGVSRSMQADLSNVNLGHDFISTPNFQSILAPRFDNNGYGANIRYNLPDMKNMASPASPLNFANMAKEGYVPSCSGYGGVASGGMPPASDPVNGVNSPDTTYMGQGNSLPIGSMTTLSAAGDPQQVQVYERYMTANPRDRLFGRGDYIRGDLPVVPDKTGWFQVHPTVSTSLNPGALAVLGGIGNQTAQQMYSLVNRDSGGARKAIGGINLSDVKMQNSYNLGLSNSIADVSVSAFP